MRMGSPEATLASAEGVGTPEGVFEELTGSLQGWKRKVSGKSGGTSKKKDVSFLTPDGEEIKTKRQLDKYLKANAGTLTASDFEWGITAGDALAPGETRRRSARLTSKGHSSNDGLDVEVETKQPVLKRSRKSDDSEKAKNGTLTGKDETMEEKEEKEEKENGEVKEELPIEESKSMDVDAPKAEFPAPEETKEVPASLEAEKEPGLVEDKTDPAPVEDTVEVSSDEISKVPAVDEIKSELVVEPETKVTVEQKDSEDNAKANGEILVTPELKTKELEPPQPQGLHALV